MAAVARLLIFIFKEKKRKEKKKKNVEIQIPRMIGPRGRRTGAIRGYKGLQEDLPV